MHQRRYTFTAVVVCLVLILLSNALLAAPAKSFRVQETDLVRLTAEAVDPDNDEIHYAYSAPLNERGEWQTDYEDAGVYEIVISAFDGVHNQTQKVILIVENKNRPPVLQEQKLVVKEEQEIDLRELIADPDHDPLIFTFPDPFDAQGTWKPTYRDEGFRVVEFMVSDGEDVLKARVEIEVLHTNHAPEIKDTFSDERMVSVAEDEEVAYWVDAADVDGERLAYAWRLDGKLIAENNGAEHYFGFNSAGEHLLAVTVSDGVAETTEQWTILVEDTNRPPEFALGPIIVKEGETIQVRTPKADEDGDILTFTFEEPFNQDGKWKTTYGDEGTYDIKVTAFDGRTTYTTTVAITVIDVDRPPLLDVTKGTISLREGEKGSWQMDTVDPDGDKVEVSITPLPEGASYNVKNKTLSWTPPYNTVTRSGGMISNIFNRLRLEHFVLQPKLFTLNITSCARELCTYKKAKFAVKNVNRAPVFALFENTSFREKDLVQLTASAADPDGDIVHYYFTKPLDKKKGTWKTDYDNQGEYTIYVTATDGWKGTTQPVKVRVLKNNRAPSLTIVKDAYVINEGQELSFGVHAADPDMEDADKLDIKLEQPPVGVSFQEGVFRWVPPASMAPSSPANQWKRLLAHSPVLSRKLSTDQEAVWLKFIASDGEAETIHPVKVTVKNVNQAPRILDSLPEKQIVAYVGEPVTFHVTAKDDDGDELSYRWTFDLGQAGVEGTDTVERTFVRAGVKTVRVVVSDGRNSVEQEWIVNIIDALQETSSGSSGSELQPFSFTVRMYVVQG